jgi:O-antigen/teichoic acid export membrane protein
MAGFTRILKNFGAMFTGNLLSVIQQVIVAPIFVARYSLAQFGEWGVLSGAVAAVGMLNFGVQTYMNQDLAIRYGSGDIAGYKLRQSTALRLLLGAIAAATALGTVIFLLPLDSWLRLDIGRRPAQWTAYLLGCQVLFNILYGYIGGIFMGASMAHRGAHWNNFQTLLNSLCLLGGVLLHLPFPALAGAQLAAMVLSILWLLVDLRRKAPGLFPDVRQWDGSAVGSILKPSGFFGLIELSTFLTYQAPLVVLQRFLGPVAVAGFILMRLLFSMCRRALAMFTQSMGAEITVLFGRKEWTALSRLYDYSERFIFFLIPLVNTGVLLLSPVIITVWMHKKAELFSPAPYVLAAAISMAISLKEHKFQFQFSTNTHEELARIMFGSYIAMFALSFPAVHWLGIQGFLGTWLAVEMFQTAFIVRLNVRLFAHIEKIEFVYLRRLIATCVVALVCALPLLRWTTELPMRAQVAIAVAAGALIAGLDWQMFGVRQVFHTITGQFSRRFQSPSAPSGPSVQT